MIRPEIGYVYINQCLNLQALAIFHCYGSLLNAVKFVAYHHKIQETDKLSHNCNVNHDPIDFTNFSRIKI